MNEVWQLSPQAESTAYIEYGSHFDNLSSRFAVTFATFATVGFTDLAESNIVEAHPVAHHGIVPKMKSIHHVRPKHNAHKIHHKIGLPIHKQIEVHVTSVNEIGNISSPNGVFSNLEKCGSKTSEYVYNNPVQQLGKCSVGSKVSITGNVPYEPQGDINHKQWQIMGIDTQNFTVSNHPVIANFNNMQTTLSSSGFNKYGTNYYWVSGKYSMFGSGAEVNLD